MSNDEYCLIYQLSISHFGAWWLKISSATDNTYSNVHRPQVMFHSSINLEGRLLPRSVEAWTYSFYLLPSQNVSYSQEMRRVACFTHLMCPCQFSCLTIISTLIWSITHLHTTLRLNKVSFNSNLGAASLMTNIGLCYRRTNDDRNLLIVSRRVWPKQPYFHPSPFQTFGSQYPNQYLFVYRLNALK